MAFHPSVAVDYPIVPYRQEHAEGVVDVIRAVHVEYGFTWEADGYHRDLYDIEGHYLESGGGFWVALESERVVGCAGVSPHGEACELHRMYLLASHRGRRIGRRLLETAFAFGRSLGCRRMILWSDVKLTLAHRLYLASGFVQAGERICDDPDQSREYGFTREPL